MVLLGVLDKKSSTGRAEQGAIRPVLLSGIISFGVIIGFSQQAFAAKPEMIVLPGSLKPSASSSTVPSPMPGVMEAAPASNAKKAGAAPGQKPFEDSGQILMQADDLNYDRTRRVVTADGHVEVAYGLRVLTADRMTYDENTGVVTADGHVALLDVDGDVVFGDHMVLRDELKDGVIDTLSVLMTDDSRMAGNRATRLDGNITVINKGVFSPCKICSVVDDKQPLWQIKAFRVTHNKEKQQLIYEDAYMEFLGVPVAYFPFFSQPDPTVKRRSGFLSPAFGSSTQLGATLKTPYYLDLGPSMDATLTPWFTAKQGLVYQGQFRQRTETGAYSFDGTANFPKDPSADGMPGDRSFRGSLFGEGEFKAPDNWGYGFKAQMTTDDTYMRQYDINSLTSLTNNIYVNRFDGPNSLTANAYYFSNLLLNPDGSKTQSPWVAPIIQYDYRIPGNYAGGQLKLSTNAMVLGYREEGGVPGVQSKRLSSTLNWERPGTTAGGLVYNLFAKLRGDIYQTENVAAAYLPNSLYGDESVARALPTMGVDFSYPLVSVEGRYRQVISPVAQLIYSPYASNDPVIPNEDSQGYTFDDTNLFSTDRFPGLDRWETGPRANIGMQYAIYSPGEAKATATVGQVYRLRPDTSFTSASGLRDEQSDYVGSLAISPSKDYTFVNRVRVSQSSLDIRQNEISLYANLSPVTAQVGWGYYGADPELGLDTRDQGLFGLSLKMTDYWSLFGTTQRNFQTDSAIYNQVGLLYQDECFGFTLTFNQSFTQDRDIKPSNGVFFRLNFKYLGAVGFGG